MKLILASLTILIFIALLLSFIYFQKKPQIDTKLSNTYTQIENIQSTIAPQPTIIKSDGLPDKHQINTTFVPQAPEKNWDQPWQDACEEAALLTVNYYYQPMNNPSVQQIITDLNSIFKYETDQDWSHDVNTTQMSQISTAMFNLKPKIINNPSVEDIKKYLSQDIPVIVPANGKTLFKENTHFKSGGPWYHAVVILGYNDNKQQFTVHDVGTQFGAYYRYSYDLLMESIHDFPQDSIKENIDTGEKNVLVLLK